MHTLPGGWQGASLLIQTPLLVADGQDIHGDGVLLPQRAEIDHNILHLLVFQRDSDLRREGSLQGRQVPIQGLAGLAPPPLLVSAAAMPNSHPRFQPQELRAISRACTFLPFAFTQVFPHLCLANSYRSCKTQFGYATICAVCHFYLWPPTTFHTILYDQLSPAGFKKDFTCLSALTKPPLAAVFKVRLET